MRLATITNWAYGATLVLTVAAGGTMLLASSAQEKERAAVAQRYLLDKATGVTVEDIYTLSDQARQYIITGDPAHVIAYRHEQAALGSVESRIGKIRDAGADPRELHALRQALQWIDTLQDEQRNAIASYQRGDATRARKILFGPEYERELGHVRTLVDRFQSRLDQRTNEDVHAATALARTLRTVSEIVLAITGLLFLCVLYFVFKQRVLRPVVRLSDVVGRLAEQDYDVEPPDYQRVDEIGDMAEAFEIFRQNGIARQRLEAERDQDRSIRDLLSRMTQRMQGADTVSDLKAVVQRFAPEIAPDLAGRLYLFDPQRNAMVECCDWQSPIHSRDSFAPMACWALRRNMPHRPVGATIDIPCDHIDSNHIIDSICLPLTAQREMLGLLYFEPASEFDGIVKTSDTYLKMLAENIGLALANLRLRDALRQMAMADPLTGLANRRQFDAIFTEKLLESERLQQPLSCVMVDIDHFKHVNDTFGHDAGDAVLKAVAKVLDQAVREEGQAFRYGGEEFVLLLPGLDADQALERAETIRHRVGTIQVSHDGKDLDTVTVSAGVATIPTHTSSERLVRTADAALYRAKKEGRNRVVVAQPRRAESAA
ncbi:diguanylate cyclase [Stakelama sediminis]|uniref:diguanylate cyclase n=1 Tax=Stakelama sediminis TaxID=463200 RepID=A0A840YV22_9SPHN|nr:diguanylate cyclase [Stakelama sediminis]MBB5717407.1 diguanylate cyclase (GGDEF)-like protein [Stakelama sediminis]